MKKEELVIKSVVARAYLLDSLDEEGYEVLLKHQPKTEEEHEELVKKAMRGGKTNLASMVFSAVALLSTHYGCKPHEVLSRIISEVRCGTLVIEPHPSKL